MAGAAKLLDVLVFHVDYLVGRHVGRRRHHFSFRSLAILHDEDGAHSPHHMAIKMAMHEPDT